MTAAVHCVVCERFTQRHHAGMAAQGLRRCLDMTDRPCTFVSPEFPRQCRTHQPAPADKTAARIEWLREQRSEGA